MAAQVAPGTTWAPAQPLIGDGMVRPPPHRWALGRQRPARPGLRLPYPATSQATNLPAIPQNNSGDTDSENNGASSDGEAAT